jgi:4-hydroxy-3-polyprenylbenzoate decarboxylase
MDVVVGITGASGAIYAVRLLEELADQCRVTLVISDAARQVLSDETDASVPDLEGMVGEVVQNSDLGAAICSGSREFDAMVIVPCSMATLGKLACGISDNAMTRAASVAMKERRKLIIVPRETPLASVHLENMLRLSRDGVIVLPAMPGFYGNPETAADLADFVVGRILDQLDMETSVGPRWGR